jgi:hypothetical protein
LLTAFFERAFTQLRERKQGSRSDLTGSAISVGKCKVPQGAKG